MDDDYVDLELIELLRQRLGISTNNTDEVSSDTGVLKDAEYIYNNAVDVAIDMWSTKSAAAKLSKVIQERGYSMDAWSDHELHPKLGEGVNEVEMANFVFTMDLLNFSFWSELSQTDRYQVDYKDKRWTGYMSLVACLQRALEEQIPITTPRFWRSLACTDDLITHVFRSATAEQIPLLDQRIAILREAGHVLEEFGDRPVDTLTQEPLQSDADPPTQGESPRLSQLDESQTHDDGHAELREETPPYAETSQQAHQEVEEVPLRVSAIASDAACYASHTDTSVITFISKADRSAGKLVNLLHKHFDCFRDESQFEGRRVRFLKRAQIFVADLNAACGNSGIGQFLDMDSLTMFPDYRVPQILHRFGVLSYCPALVSHIERKLPLTSGTSWEVQIRGCSIWAIELLRREMAARQHHASGKVNSVLIDFLLYDLAKEQEFQNGTIQHHRTRSIYY